MGEASDKKGRLALERQLQKTFKNVQSLSGVLQTVSAETLPVMKSVANLLEQYECCAAVDYSSLPTLPFAADFPDLKVRLLSKIKEEMEEKVEELETKIEVLREKEEVMSKHCEASWSLVSKYAPSLDITSLCAASPASFPLADMLEWLDTVHTLLHQQYWSKAHLLDQVLTGEGVTADSLLASWTDQDDLLIHTVKICLTKVELFVSEKR